MSIGTNLSNIRKEKGLTQKDVADFLYVSNKTISKWENDEIIPDITYLQKLSNYYQVSIDFLIGNDVESTPINKRINLPLLAFTITLILFCELLYSASFVLLLKEKSSTIIIILMYVGFACALSSFIISIIRYIVNKKAYKVLHSILIAITAINVFSGLIILISFFY